MRQSKLEATCLRWAGRLLVAPALGCLALAGCHPPDREIYEQSRNCVGVFHVATQRIPPGRLRQAGLYADDVEQAATDDANAALKFGPKAGIDKESIYAGLDDSRATAQRLYGKSDPSDLSSPLIQAVKACMPKPEGPND